MDLCKKGQREIYRWIASSIVTELVESQRTKHPHMDTYVCTTVNVIYILGIVAPALWQLVFKRSPGSFLGVHIVLITRVLKMFTSKVQKLFVPETYC